MDKPNVNNLNGIPNFGHGEVIPTETIETSIDEVKEDTDTEDKPKKAKKN